MNLKGVLMLLWLVFCFVLFFFNFSDKLYWNFDGSCTESLSCFAKFQYICVSFCPKQ